MRLRTVATAAMCVLLTTAAASQCGPSSPEPPPKPPEFNCEVYLTGDTGLVIVTVGRIKFVQAQVWTSCTIPPTKHAMVIYVEALEAPAVPAIDGRPARDAVWSDEIERTVGTIPTPIPNLTTVTVNCIPNETFQVVVGITGLGPAPRFESFGPTVIKSKYPLKVTQC